MEEEFPATRQTLIELQTMMQQLVEGRGSGEKGWKRSEGESSDAKQSKLGKGVEGFHRDYFQYTNGNFSSKFPKLEFLNSMVKIVMDGFAKLFKESVIGEFHKLRQTGTVEQYYNEFETLRSIMANKGCRFDESYFIHNFVSGLRDKIRLKVDKFEVFDLSRSIYLARK
ncbi:hypothetical protein RJ640_003567 [Escallonia rubra]|uniref:Retrotransposon gag domain-containing protein n=1 Tax=Escallonia rubra TaxID=112253 RepID=A0AA88UB34_9ASTE|nr:hypothetical protein RJ640_003567 [Escallonia rubra]